MGDSAPTKALPQPASSVQPTQGTQDTQGAQGAQDTQATQLVERTPAPDRALPPADQFDAGSALLRLLVGGMLLGADELRERLRRWDDRSLAADAVVSVPPQTRSMSLRRALIGAAFEAQARMRRGFSAIVTRAEYLADDANLAYTRLTYAVRGTPLDAARRRLDELLFVALTAADRWSERGQIEERQGRRVAERAVVGVIDELLDYMAQNPEVRHLIEEQGTGMAGSAVGEARGRAASADQWIEQLAHNLLHRQSGDKRGSQAKSASVSLPAIPPQPASVATATTAPTQLPASKARKPAPGTTPGMASSAGTGG